MAFIPPRRLAAVGLQEDVGRFSLPRGVTPILSHHIRDALDVSFQILLKAMVVGRVKGAAWARGGCVRG